MAEPLTLDEEQSAIKRQAQAILDEFFPEPGATPEPPPGSSPAQVGARDLLLRSGQPVPPVQFSPRNSVFGISKSGVPDSDIIRQQTGLSLRPPLTDPREPEHKFRDQKMLTGAAGGDPIYSELTRNPDYAKQFTPVILRNLSRLYLLKSAPAGDDYEDAFKATLSTYFNAQLVDQGEPHRMSTDLHLPFNIFASKKTDQETEDAWYPPPSQTAPGAAGYAAGRIAGLSPADATAPSNQIKVVRPPRPDVAQAITKDPTSVMNLYNQWAILPNVVARQRFRGQLKSADKDTYDFLEGDRLFPYIESRLQDHLFQTRLSTVLGQPLNFGPQNIPARVPMARYANREIDTFPRADDAAIDQLAPTDPDLQSLLDWRQQKLAQDQALREAERQGGDLSKYPGLLSSVVSPIQRALSFTADPLNSLIPNSPPLSLDEMNALGVEKLYSGTIKALDFMGLGAFESGTGLLRAGVHSISDKGASYFDKIGSLAYSGLVSFFDPKGTEQLAQLDERWRSLNPVGDPTIQRLDHLGAAQYTRLVLDRLAQKNDPSWNILGIQNPHLRATLSNMAGDLLDDGASFLMLAGGALSAYRASRGFRDAPELSTPLNRFSHLEKGLQRSNVFSPVPAHLRAPMLSEISGALDAVKDPEVARGILSRLDTEIKIRGPVDPQTTAAAVTALNRARNTLDALSGTTFSSAAKQDLVALTPHISEIFNPQRALYILHGRDTYVGPHTSAAVAQSYTDYLTGLEKLPPTDLLNMPEPHLLEKFRPGQWNDWISSLLEKSGLQDEFAQRRALLTPILDDLQARKSTEQSTTSSYLERLKQARQAAVDSHNDMIAQHFNRYKQLELQGGETQASNPALRKKLYRDLFDFTHGSPRYSLSDLLKSEDTLKEAAGPEAPALRKHISSPDLTIRTRATIRLGNLAQDWLRDNSRPEIQKIPPNPRPNLRLIDALEKKIGATPGDELPPLTPTDLDALNKHLPPGAALPKDHLKIATSALRAFDLDIESTSRSLDKTKSFLDDLGALRSHMDSLDPLKPGQRITVGKDFLKTIEAELATPGALITDERYPGTLGLSTGLSELGRSGLDSFHEAINTLSDDARTLGLGLRKYGALDYSIASTFYPDKIPWMLRDQKRVLDDADSAARYRARQIEKYATRALTPTERQAAFYAVRYNDISRLSQTNPAFGAVDSLLQQDRIRLLMDGYRAGKIPPDLFKKWIGDPTYYHGQFEQSEIARLAFEPIRPPSRYRLLQQLPGGYSFKIPEEGFWLEYRDTEGKIQRQTGFPDARSASGWVEKNLPENTEVAIRPPMSFTTKVARGLITEPIWEHMDLASNLAYNNTSDALSRELLHVPALTKTSFEQLPEGGHLENEHTYLDGTGARWFLMDHPGLSHLRNTWVHENALHWLYSQNVEFATQKAILDKIGDHYGSYFGTLFKTIKNPVRSLLWDTERRFTKDAGPDAETYLHEKANPLIPVGSHLAEKFLGHLADSSIWQKLMSVSGNILGMAKVATSIGMFPLQLGSNLFVNLPLMGFPILDPVGWYHFLKYGVEGTAALMRPLKDDAWNALGSNLGDNHAGYAESMRRLFDEHYKSWSVYQDRISRANDALDKAVSDNNGSAAADQAQFIATLKNERNAKFPHHMSGFFGQFLDWMKNSGLPALQNTFTSKGRIQGTLYGMVGFMDNISKYAAYRFLTEHRNTSPETAVDYIEKFAQNLQRVPSPIAELSKRFGGSKFTTFPLAQATVFANMLKYQPGTWLQMKMKHLLWNSAMLYSGQQGDPEDSLNRYALEWGTQRSGLTDMTYLLSRYLLPGGFHLSSDPEWGWLIPRSLFSRPLAEEIQHSDQPMLAKVAESAALGFASKFALGSVPLNILGTLLTGRDYNGDPAKGIGGAFRVLAQNLTPDWLPPLGRDYLEWQKSTSTNYVDPTTGQSKSLMEYALRRYLNIIGPSDLTPAQNFKIALYGYQAMNPKYYRQQGPLARDDTLTATLFARGKIQGGKILLDAETKKIYDDWYSQPGHHESFPGPHGEPIEVPLTPKKRDEALKDATLPSSLAAFKNTLSPEGKMFFYPVWRRVNRSLSNPDARLLDNFMLKTIDSSLKSQGPTPLQVKWLKTSDSLWLNDPDLPDDAKSHIRRWLSTYGVQSYNKALRDVK